MKIKNFARSIKNESSEEFKKPFISYLKSAFNAEEQNNF